MRTKPRVCLALPRLPTEGAVEDSGIDFTPLRLGEHFEWGALLIVALNVGEVRQPVVIADQLAMNLDGRVNRRTAGPLILTHSGLNAELTLDQVLPWVPLLIHRVRDLKAAVDATEGVRVELLAVIRDHLIPTAPLQEREIIEAQDHA